MSDLDTVFEIQRAAYKPLYEKYHDYESNPYTETKDTVFHKYTKNGTYGYLFVLDSMPVGAVRIAADDPQKSAWVSALCVLPQFQGRGIAQMALLEIERLHPEIKRWSLNTVLQESGSCHLYEKLGYKRTGETKVFNEKMTLVFYEKV